MGKKYILCGLALLALCRGTSEGQKSQLSIFTWPNHISEEILTGFAEEFGVHVRIDTYASNEELLAELSAGAMECDIVMPSDYMVSILVKHDLLAELDRDKIPNLQNISPQFLGKYYDPENRYSVPYVFGTAGIAYDAEVVLPDPDSWAVLWNEKYRNQLSMLDDQRETLGVALKLLGYSLNTTNATEINAAKKRLIAQKPLVKQYKSETRELLVAGDVVMAHCWSGDAIRAMETRPSIRYLIPKEGSSQFIDTVCIAKSATHKELATQFINYLLRPEINAKITTFTKYGTGVPAAKEYVPQHLRDNAFIYPAQEVLESLETIRDVGDFTRYYDSAWEEVRAK